MQFVLLTFILIELQWNVALCIATAPFFSPSLHWLWDSFTSLVPLEMQCEFIAQWNVIFKWKSNRKALEHNLSTLLTLNQIESFSIQFEYLAFISKNSAESIYRLSHNNKTICAIFLKFAYKSSGFLKKVSILCSSSEFTLFLTTIHQSKSNRAGDLTRSAEIGNSYWSPNIGRTKAI